MNIITDITSPNYNDRASGKEINTLILHFIGDLSAQGALDTYANPESQLSAHYMLDINGDAYALVDEGKRAWHAGKSYWQGETDLNSTSIGIEIVNRGYAPTATPYPDTQITALIELCQQICARHSAIGTRILGHSDIAPARKIDPGHLFPWERLAQEGLGLWPVPERQDYDNHDVGLLTTLHQIGYNPECDGVTLVREFQRHYESHIFEKGHEGQATEHTHAIATALLRMMS